ncbi:MAG: hydantoinase B/oxoprolinase family protein [Deltaproteobacteria bacterium]|nr:hydantoinase B/oxoprolinase family protein [Deltaproteobacteria bacterium]
MSLEPGAPPSELSAEEQQLLRAFIDTHKLFYGPDPEIMREHRLAPRTAAEDAILRHRPDPHRLQQVRGRLDAALSESFTMVEQMGAAPGAKWGDLVTAVFTAAGDLAMIGPRGIVGFAGVCHYPLKFVKQYWSDEPTVGVRDGDGFIHNDSRYGGVHNTDQSLIMPVFADGELIGWVSSTIHEGENGACEPGGMPAKAESKWDEGLKMPPFKIVEHYRIKRDLLTFLQNSVRDPKLQYEDLKVKLHACIRLIDRLHAICAEFGREYLIATLRQTLEDTEAEVRRRIAAMPDGTVRAVSWLDSTLRENALIKISVTLTVRGEQITADFRGTAPQFTNRSINAVIAPAKIALLTTLLQNIWPDLPHNQAVIAPVDFVSDSNSLIDASVEAPNAMSLLPLFRLITLFSLALAKFCYSVPKRYTNIIASQYNQPATFVYGGLTQHFEVTGNFCADINGNGQGARENRDGEHALSPLFGYMCDTGEQELNEEELPMVRLIAQQLARDRVGWGKYRGGLGYEQMVAVRGSAMWGFMTAQSGSWFCSAPPLFGGYGCPAYPVAKVKGVNVFDYLAQHGTAFPFDIVRLMNERPIPGGQYLSQDAGMAFELAREGEIYMTCQGAGAGYGDVLEREPALVMKDLSEELISHESARAIYCVVYDQETLVVDEDATCAARAAERMARRRRGQPYAEFVKQWATAEPPMEIPYYGSWDDDTVVYAGQGALRQRMPAGNITEVFMPDPKDLRIAELEAQLGELQSRTGAAR